MTDEQIDDPGKGLTDEDALKILREDTSGLSRGRARRLTKGIGDKPFGDKYCCSAMAALVFEREGKKKSNSKLLEVAAYYYIHAAENAYEMKCYRTSLQCTQNAHDLFKKAYEMNPRRNPELTRRVSDLETRISGIIKAHFE